MEDSTEKKMYYSNGTKGTIKNIFFFASLSELIQSQMNMEGSFLS